MKYSILIIGEGPARGGSKKDADIMLADFFKSLQGEGQEITHASFKTDGATTTLIGGPTAHPRVPGGAAAPGAGEQISGLAEDLFQRLKAQFEMDAETGAVLIKLIKSSHAGIEALVDAVPALEKKLDALGKRPGKKEGAAALSVLVIAMVCHEINRAYCAALGDVSQAPWDQAPEWQRTSAVKGVEFRLNNPDAPASASHDSWLKEKADTGWKHGPVKDAEKKEHPCFVPYEELPPEQQMKDKLFIAVVDALKGQLPPEASAKA